ncbi:adenosine deaminase, partial [Glaciimonas sp. Cout2]|nr:adenosine deaminase [Glaciimonas sp. Cout2]
MNVLITEQDFYDLATAYFRRASADGVRHVEAFFDPQAHTSRGIPLLTALGGVADALGTSVPDFGISTKLIVTFL